MKLDCSLARKHNTAAISSGLAARPSRLPVTARRALSVQLSAISVRTKPGATAFTVTAGARALAKDAVTFSSAALAAEYAAICGLAILSRPRIDETVTIRPRPRRIIEGATARMKLTGPQT